MDETRGHGPEGLVGEPATGAGEVDPAGLPRPASDEWFGVVMKAMMVIGLAGAGFLAIMAAAPMRTCGATRSTRLRWERRRRIMAEEVRRSDADTDSGEAKKGRTNAAATE
jgi:hypothetical protein